MDIRQLLQKAAQDPRLQPALTAAQRELSDASPEQVEKLIGLIEFALTNPGKYPQIRAEAIANDMADPEDLPEQFDPQALAAILVVLYKLREAPSPEMMMAGGGLARMRTLASRGRMGDTMLAHISPEEAAMLRAQGGAGTINPATGLPQFFKFKNLLKALVPIAINFIAPGLGAAVGTALGATGTAASILGQAVIGGVTAAATGGNPLQGAVLGGMGAGLGPVLGGGVSDALGLGLGQTGQQILGGALVGGVTGAATGQGFGRGALLGGAGAGLGAAAQGVLPGAAGAGLGAGAQTFGNMLAAGYRPQEAIAGGALTGLASGLMSRPAGPGLKPSDSMAEGLNVKAAPTADMGGLKTNYLTGKMEYAPGAPVDYSLPQATPSGITAQPSAQSPLQTAKPSGFNLKGAMQYAPLLALAGQPKPPAVEQAITKLPLQQQEYFNRPNVAWDWNKMQADAAAANMSLSQFMANNWPRITGYSSSADARQGAYAAPMAMGGAYQGGGLSAMARFVRGGGSGRDDEINARLSDGEYVMDAETVAMLGDGSTNEGARRLDQMRAKLRKHKGKALVRGKFSPNAKSPLSYLQGAA